MEQQQQVREVRLQTHPGLEPGLTVSKGFVHAYHHASCAEARMLGLRPFAHAMIAPHLKLVANTVVRMCISICSCA